MITHDDTEAFSDSYAYSSPESASLIRDALESFPKELEDYL